MRRLTKTEFLLGALLVVCILMWGRAERRLRHERAQHSIVAEQKADLWTDLQEFQARTDFWRLRWHNLHNPRPGVE